MRETPVNVDHTRELALSRDMSSHIIRSGSIGSYCEPPGNGLHHVFLLHLKEGDWVGRRTLRRGDGQRWQPYSALHPSMLLGPHIQSQWSNDGVSIYFRATSAAQKAMAFESALTSPDAQLHFPFALVDDAGREAVCPQEYWHVSESLAVRLNADEQHFREHCVALLKTLSKPGTVIYDPACSTGEFIAHLADRLPDCRCLGSDRSVSMIEYAQNHHGLSRVGFRVMEAEISTESGIRCDVLILRFLNAEVMTRSEAHTIFGRLMPCVNPGGTILIFGHTPVLLAVTWLIQTFGLTLVSSVAARSGRQELFQFYRLTVPTSGSLLPATVNHDT
ncbi:class I SAM-dependent methyltransferase [Pseudomonas sp. NPDC089534]|uniref:class I SAM-dependent methyltransferase n=1 Tax=Pseudomonas sp. NPDC089534 TaxID=3364468 RepID=UPI0037FA9A92